MNHASPCTHNYMPVVKVRYADNRDCEEDSVVKRSPDDQAFI